MLVPLTLVLIVGLFGLGYRVTANNAVMSFAYPYPIAQNRVPGYRACRTGELIEADAHLPLDHRLWRYDSLRLDAYHGTIGPPLPPSL